LNVKFNKRLNIKILMISFPCFLRYDMQIKKFGRVSIIKILLVTFFFRLSRKPLIVNNAMQFINNILLQRSKTPPWTKHYLNRTQHFRLMYFYSHIYIYRFAVMNFILEEIGIKLFSITKFLHFNWHSVQWLDLRCSAWYLSKWNCYV
jgi:hypothetical protein